MSEGNTGKRYASGTDWKRIDRLTDREIEAAVASDPEAELLDKAFWDNARVAEPQEKAAISLRVDRDVLDWFRRAGKGYQTRMNAVLRAYMEARMG